MVVGRFRALAAKEATGSGRGGGGSPKVTTTAGWRGRGRRRLADLSPVRACWISLCVGGADVGFGGGSRWRQERRVVRGRHDELPSGAGLVRRRVVVVDVAAGSHRSRRREARGEERHARGGRGDNGERRKKGYGCLVVRTRGKEEDEVGGNVNGLCGLLLGLWRRVANSSPNDVQKPNKHGRGKEWGRVTEEEKRKRKEIRDKTKTKTSTVSSSSS
jgi:hypothetical protein